MTEALRRPMKISSFCPLSFSNGLGILLAVNTWFLVSGASGSVTWRMVGAIPLSFSQGGPQQIVAAPSMLCLIRKQQVQTNLSTIIRYSCYLSPPFLRTQILWCSESRYIVSGCVFKNSFLKIILVTILWQLTPYVLWYLWNLNFMSPFLEFWLIM